MYNKCINIGKLCLYSSTPVKLDCTKLVVRNEVYKSNLLRNSYCIFNKYSYVVVTSIVI